MGRDSGTIEIGKQLRLKPLRATWQRGRLLTIQPLSRATSPTCAQRIKDFLEHPPLLSVAMDNASIFTIQVSAREGLHPHAYHPPPSPTTSLSPTLVNNAPDSERPSLKLRFPSGASNILNSLVVNEAGQSLYSISSNSKRTILVSCLGNVEIASVQWDRSSPRMVFRGKKWKCRYWLPRTAPDKECVPAPC
jgi:hypothetical protein